VPMPAELVDAVVGVDTHRDTHDVEIALPTGAPIATCTIRNDRLRVILQIPPNPLGVVRVDADLEFRRQPVP
jgi:hypothetical protein